MRDRSEMPKIPNTHRIDALVGDRLRARRMMLGISQLDLAEALGISFQQVQKYENGKNRISASRLFEIAAALDISISYFFEGASKLGKKWPAPLRRPN
jgi:transcriptional regulator with XRE-family HTH domain